jgi:hypothetical protein
LSQLTIHDATPAYTSFVNASAASTPATLSACLKTTPATATPVTCSASDAPGGHGAVGWQFTGDLAPGATGSVLFKVLMD